MAENFIDETKDAEQITMEMQTAYLAGEEDGELTTAYKEKRKGHSKGEDKGFKGKGFGKAKGKGYDKGLGKKGYKSRPGELSLEDGRRKL